MPKCDLSIILWERVTYCQWAVVELAMFFFFFKTGMNYISKSIDKSTSLSEIAICRQLMDTWLKGSSFRKLIQVSILTYFTFCSSCGPVFCLMFVNTSQAILRIIIAYLQTLCFKHNLWHLKAKELSNYWQVSGFSTSEFWEGKKKEEKTSLWSKPNHRNRFVLRWCFWSRAQTWGCFSYFMEATWYFFFF